MFIDHGTLTESFSGIDVCIVVGFQMSSLSRNNDKDSFRLSWGAEHLDNVVLSSSLLHSGLGQCTHTQMHFHTHRLTHRRPWYTPVLYTWHCSHTLLHSLCLHGCLKCPLGGRSATKHFVTQYVDNYFRTAVIPWQHRRRYC